MVRGLFGKWKQPVYFDFDTRMTKEIIFQIIEELHKINYNVVACVSDCGPTNQGFWTSLKISIDKTFFEHPVTKDQILVFGDTPHLLKLIRNNLVDRGFTLPNGCNIRRYVLDELIEKTNTEVSSTFKLSPLSMNCVSNERQNVGLAKHLLSHRTSVALKRYFSTEESHNLADFIELVDKWFDVMNSRNFNESLHVKRPYGLYLDYQDNILDEMYDLILNMKGIGKNCLYVFQKFILISIKSLRILYDKMKQLFPTKFSFILTHRLNQDLLENLFSQLRTRGGNDDHPSPLNSIYRLRMIILGKNTGVVKTNMSTIDSSDDEFLLSLVFKEVKIEPTIDQTKVSDDEEESDSSVASSHSSIQMTMSEADGFEYVLGWIARKFKTKYPELGDYSYKLTQPESSNPSYVQQLSHGGLTVPSSSWIKKGNELEKFFRRYHPNDKFQHKKKVISSLSRKICKKRPDFEADLVRAFIQQRTFIRIKYLNTALRQKKISKNVAKNHPKLKKIVT